MMKIGRLCRIAFCVQCVYRNSFALVETTQKNTIRIGARPSPLAQVQAKAVADALDSSSSSKVQTTLLTIRADGDHTAKAAGTQSLPLAVSSVDFTGSLDEALLSGRIDVAVHSLKDIPPTARWRGKDELKMAGHLPREDSRDVLVGPYKSIADLPPNAKVGTSSVRRQAQLLGLRPDLNLVNLRGNVQTRLGALEDGTVDGLILAQAGLNRLQQQQSSSASDIIQEGWCHPIPFQDLLSGACQGIVVAVCRADGSVALDYLTQINDSDSSIAAAAERAFLDALDSFSPSKYEGSSVGWTGRPPLAAHMEQTDKGGWRFEGLLARPDGSRVIRERQHSDKKDLSIEEASTIGTTTAEKIMEEAGLDFYQ